MNTLFKLDSKNKLRELNIWNEEGTVKRAAGLYKGKLVYSDKVCKPKNVGKVNETSPTEQALLEIQSEINKKVDEGYVVAPSGFTGMSNEEIEQYIKDNVASAPKAMLAKPFSEKYADFEKGVLISPKLDGMRCLAEVTEKGVTLWSRGGKQIDTMGHIEKQLELLRKEHNWTGVLDGELYIHSDDSENFQDIMKAVKKYRKGVSETVVYSVYDIVDEDTPALSRFDRYDMMLSTSELPNVVPVAQTFSYDFEQVALNHAEYLSQGYEGTMIKNAASFYKGSRTSDLLKFKDFKDEEFLIVDVVPMENKPEYGVIVLEKDGKQFKATPKFNFEERARLLKEKDSIIGSMGTVTYFSLSDDGIPRFPVFKGVRNAEDLLKAN